MVNPSKPADTQGNCIFFKLAAETRNQIYGLVYATDTNEDEAVELNETTFSPCKDLLLTCQEVHNESRKMYQAAYRNYPIKFTIDIASRRSLPFIPALDNRLWRRMKEPVVTWRAGERNKREPLRFTATFNFGKEFQGGCKAWVDTKDTYWRGKRHIDNICLDYRKNGERVMSTFDWAYLRMCVRMDPREDVRDGLAHAIINAVS
jgi:hypothetical protein